MRCPRTRTRHDQAVVLRPTVLGEIENMVQEVVAQGQVAVREDHLDFLALRLRHDFARGRDDGRTADQVKALFAAALGASSHPQTVLIGVGLQRQQLLERRVRLVLAVAGQLNLAVARDDSGLLADQDAGIEAPTLGGHLCVAEVKADLLLAREVKQRLRVGTGHAGPAAQLFAFVEKVIE